MAPTELYLVRHGESEWNQTGRYSGVSDCALSPAGLRQADAVAAWIRHLPVEAVYTSPLSRARLTAERVAAATSRPLRNRPSLIERNYGEWEGLTNEEIRAGWPDLYARFKEDPAATTPPGGEACARVARRIRRALLALAWAHRGGSLAVVGHKTAFRIFLAPILGVPLPDYYRAIPMANAAVSLVRVAGRDVQLVWFNRTGHLGPC